MTGLPVSSLSAALAAVTLVALSLPVSFKRMELKVSVGDGGDEGLRRRIRAQGNFIEYAPMVLIVLALVEAGGGPPPVLWTLGVLLIAGRWLHAAGMLRGSQPLRGAGMLCTFACLLGGAALLTARFAAG